MMKSGVARTCEGVGGRLKRSDSNTRHATTRSGLATASGGVLAAVVRSVGEEAVTAGQEGSCGADGGHWCSALITAKLAAAVLACRAWVQPD